jgi:ribosomal protein S26
MEGYIDGCPVEEKTIQAPKQTKACGRCGFSNWTKGDVKFIIEHWSNDDCCHDMEGSREHLCRTCAVRARIPSTSSYHSNKTSPPFDDHKMNVLDDAKEGLSHVECDKCSRSVADVPMVDTPANRYQMFGCIVTHQPDSGSITTSYCMVCAIDCGIVQLPPSTTEEVVQNNKQIVGSRNTKEDVATTKKRKAQPK